MDTCTVLDLTLYTYTSYCATKLSGYVKYLNISVKKIKKIIYIYFFFPPQDLYREKMAPAARDFTSRHEPLPSQRPDNTAFTQQRLPAWQPLLSASIILPLFFFVGLSFIGIGIGLYYSSNSITEKEVRKDYRESSSMVTMGWIY